MAKFRQIGAYSVEYLYKNDCTLEELTKHLLRLSNASSSTEDSGTLVERGTDFDCVQIMTIHASKGLEFPVVIAVAGFKGRNNQIPKSYLYHDENDKKAKLSFSDYGSKKMKEEEAKEWQRLFYVAYTRASSLMILPYYKKWDDSRSKELYKFLKTSIDTFVKENESLEKIHISSEEKTSSDDDFYKDLKNVVKKILENRKIAKDSSSEEDQISVLKTLSENLSGRGLKKNSYTTLANAKKAKNSNENDFDNENGNFRDKERENDEKESGNPLKSFDSARTPIQIQYDKSQKPWNLSENYPRGNDLGSALHEIFEKIDFKKIYGTDGKILNFEDFAKDDVLCSLIDESFEHYGFSIDEADSEKWRLQSAGIVWNTLQAKFPEIIGTKSTGNFFSLNEISFEKRASEAEFNFAQKTTDETFLKNYCNGFIDLIFVREIDGKEIYSVLDWKSNALKNYADFEILKSKTDSAYSIQRVLYSYCLIKWLKNFPKFCDMSEDEIFENHFGGIYYVYLRGCSKNLSNGIYAQTWKKWSDLEGAFKSICKELMGEGK